MCFSPAIRHGARSLAIAAVTLTLILAAGAARARGSYQAPDAFLAEVFGGDVPRPARLWVDGELRTAAKAILDHELGQLRVRYWARGNRSAWILDEIGKERPITTGLVVVDGKLELMRVLVYRESRGGEVRYPFFTDQFRGAGLTGRSELDRTIDGISGATLSVRALTRLARLALLLDRQIRTETAADGGIAVGQNLD